MSEFNYENALAAAGMATFLICTVGLWRLAIMKADEFGFFAYALTWFIPIILIIGFAAGFSK